MTASPFRALERAYGLARSAMIYGANPAKRRRARRFYGALVRPGDLCFDIGAHLGDRTAHFLTLGARVVAVEPQPQLMALLRRRFGRNPHLRFPDHADERRLRLHRRVQAIADEARAGRRGGREQQPHDTLSTRVMRH